MIKRSSLLLGLADLAKERAVLLSRIDSLAADVYEIRQQMKIMEQNQRILASRYADFESRWPSLKRSA
jgi:hypothetical protein